MNGEEGKILGCIGKDNEGAFKNISAPNKTVSFQKDRKKLQTAKSK